MASIHMYLPGFYDQSQVNEMMRESIKMRDFDHPNVLTLVGVCIDGGPSPYIVTPFMANGSLHSYLKEHRTELILGEGADEDDVSSQPNVLIRMGNAETVQNTPPNNQS